MEFERRVARQFVEKVFATVGLEVEGQGEHLPIEDFSRGLLNASALKYPELPRGEALRRIGHEVVARSRTSRSSSVGEVVSTLSGKLDASGPFEPRVTPRGEGHYVAHFDDVACLPTFFLGLFEAVTSSTHPEATVTWRPEGLSGARYEVRVPSEHLARVEQPLRVERALELAHQ